MPLGSVANKVRTVPRDTPMVAAALAVGTSFGAADLDLRLEGDEASKTVT